MGSLSDVEYNQRGNRFLLITEAYLEPSRKSTMNLFCKIKTIFARKPDRRFRLDSDMPLYYLLAKVHRMSRKRSTKSFFSLKLGDNSKIVTVLYYRNTSTIQRDKLSNRATQVK